MLPRAEGAQKKKAMSVSRGRGTQRSKAKAPNKPQKVYLFKGGSACSSQKKSLHVGKERGGSYVLG